MGFDCFTISSSIRFHTTKATKMLKGELKARCHKWMLYNSESARCFYFPSFNFIVVIPLQNNFSTREKTFKQHSSCRPHLQKMLITSCNYECSSFIFGDNFCFHSRQKHRSFHLQFSNLHHPGEGEFKTSPARTFFFLRHRMENWHFRSPENLFFSAFEIIFLWFIIHLPFSIFPFGIHSNRPFHKQKPTWPERLLSEQKKKEWMELMNKPKCLHFPLPPPFVKMPSSVILFEWNFLSRVMR